MTNNIVLSKSFKRLSFLATVLIVSFALGNFVFAVWSEPSTDPPGDNVPAPINVSVDAQTKDGDLSVAALYDATDPTSTYFIDLDSAIISGVFKSKVGIGMVPTNANLEIDMEASAAEGLHISRTAFGANSYLNIKDELGDSIFKVHEKGNVGIGATDPSTQLQLEGDSGNAAEISLIHTQVLTGGSAGIYFDVTADLSSYAIKAYDNKLGFYTLNPATRRMTILPDGNVGIGASDPTQKLEIDGGVKLNTVDAKPACDATTRGTFWFTREAAGVKDSVTVCAKDAADTYAWEPIN